MKIFYLTLCSRCRSKRAVCQLSRRKSNQWCKACRTRVPGRSCGVQMESDRAAFTEDVRKQRTAQQCRDSQRKGYTHETAILMESDFNSICPERLPHRQVRLKHSSNIIRL